MKIKFLNVFAILFVLGSCTQKAKTFTALEISMLPISNRVTLEESLFLFKDNFTICFRDESQKTVVNHFQKAINETASLQGDVKEVARANIFFTKVESLQSKDCKLIVTPKTITISASKSKGCFYGVQTFPCIAAYADVDWTRLNNKDYEKIEAELAIWRTAFNGTGLIRVT